MHQCLVILDLRLWKLRQQNHMTSVTSLLRKAPFKNCFPSAPGLFTFLRFKESVLEKHRFRDGFLDARPNRRSPDSALFQIKLQPLKNYKHNYTFDFRSRPFTFGEFLH